MGREARCRCRWGEHEGLVTVLLEPNELIVRGAVRRRAALNVLEQVRAHGDILAFVAAGERIELVLGAQLARRWASAIAAPPPTLAQKLGITQETRLHTVGKIDDAVLRAAVSMAGTVATSPDGADLAIIRTDDIAHLKEWVGSTASIEAITPTWVVYVKGRGAPLGESGLREFMRRAGFIDTKVASVSERLTALRFIKKR
jgi:hypothetical protein